MLPTPVPNALMTTWSSSPRGTARAHDTTKHHGTHAICRPIARLDARAALEGSEALKG